MTLLQIPQTCSELEELHSRAAGSVDYELIKVGNRIYLFHVNNG